MGRSGGVRSSRNVDEGGGVSRDAFRKVFSRLRLFSRSALVLNLLKLQQGLTISPPLSPPG